MLTEQERDALRAARVVELMTAARQAGLRFKNGELDKAGILARLEAFPSMARATLAALRRAPAGPKRNPFLDDTSEEEFIGERAPPPPAAAVDLSNYVTRTTWEEGRATDKFDLQVFAKGLIRSLSARVEDLEKTRPIAFSLAGKTELAIPDGLTHPKLPLVLSILASGENALLVGPASSGKTTAAKQVREVLAKLFEREDYRLCATGAVGDGYALLGYKNATGEYQRTLFRDAVEFGHLFMFDEVDGSAADALLVINSLDNGFVAFPDAVVNIHPHFRLIAGANTDGSGATMQFSGRTRLDGAFLDRFAKVDWVIDPRIEAFLSRGDSAWLEAVRAVRAFADKREILDVVATARATRRGPLFLANGMARMDVLETTCKRGALAECWADVLALSPVQAFLKA